VAPPRVQREKVGATTHARCAAALRESPQDSFGTSCTPWRNMQQCIGGDRGGNGFMFSLNERRAS